MPTNPASYTRAYRARRGHSRWRGDPAKKKARDILWQHVRSGRLERPLACERCGEIPPRDFRGCSQVEAHHPDYSEPLLVEWLCPGCHVEADRA